MWTDVWRQDCYELRANSAKRRQADFRYILDLAKRNSCQLLHTQCDPIPTEGIAGERTIGSVRKHDRVAIRQGGIVIISLNTNTNVQSELKQAVRERIVQASGVRVDNLEVEVDGDSVVLSGRCSSFYTKQLAQHAALEVINSRSLENRIEVRAGENLLTDRRSAK